MNKTMVIRKALHSLWDNYSIVGFLIKVNLDPHHLHRKGCTKSLGCTMPPPKAKKEA
jgi:hypothetical protein